MTDNGGPLTHTYNYPLRGGKHDYWEGGVRGEAFVYSPLLPAKVQGTQWGGLSHASDWYLTVIEGIAGATLPTNTGVRDIDGINLWDALQTGGPSPRSKVIIQTADDAVYVTTLTPLSIHSVLR